MVLVLLAARDLSNQLVTIDARPLLHVCCAGLHPVRIREEARRLSDELNAARRRKRKSAG